MVPTKSSYPQTGQDSTHRFLRSSVWASILFPTLVFSPLALNIKQLLHFISDLFTSKSCDPLRALSWVSLYNLRCAERIWICLARANFARGFPTLSSETSHCESTRGTEVEISSINQGFFSDCFGRSNCEPFTSPALCINIYQYAFDTQKSIRGLSNHFPNLSELRLGYSKIFFFYHLGCNLLSK